MEAFQDINAAPGWMLEWCPRFTVARPILRRLPSPRLVMLFAVTVFVACGMLGARATDALECSSGSASEVGLGASANMIGPSPQAKPTPKQAIHDGLAWLARHQNSDGSWGIAVLKEHCTPGKPCSVEDPKHPFTSHYDEGLTGLSILSFLRAGYGPDAKYEIIDPVSQRHYAAGGVVSRALVWLKSKQNEAGSFQHEIAFMYNQDIATVAMVEAASASKSEEWKESAQRGVEMIEAAQRTSPSGEGRWGWRYAPRPEIEARVGAHPKDEKGERELHDADTSVTAWSAAALAGAQALGVQVKKEALDGAIDFCNFVSLTDGRVGYLDPSGAGLAVTGLNDHFLYHTAVMSALGMVIRLYANKDRKHPFFELAAQQILRDLPMVSSDKLSIDYYYWYEASLALNHFDGESSGVKTKKKYSGPWNKAATQVLIDLQDRAKGACSNGGWTTPDRWSYTGGAIYCTAMSVLSLEACNPK
jgi:hypothetical protein